MNVLYAGIDPEPLTMGNTGEDRKPGVHLSDITKRMAWERDKKYHPDAPIDMMTLERGFTWEYILEGALNRRHRRPGYRPDQILEDGVWLSPDWVNPDSDIQVEEWKATKKSMKRGFDDVGWSWLPNSMAYLRALLRQKKAHALAIRFRIWWINGDYSYDAKTSDFHLLNEYWRVDVEFTKRELEDNWRGILSHGQKYGLLPTPPKDEPAWQSRPRLEATLKRRQEQKRTSGRDQQPSRETAAIVTFPNTKTSKNRRSAS